MFTNEILSAGNVYDIMAICYIHIVQNKDFDINNSYDKSIMDNYNRILNKYLEDKQSNPCNAFRNLKKEILASLHCIPLSVTVYYSLLISIDACEIYHYKTSTLEDAPFKTYNSLNTLHNQTVKIYPVLPSNYRDCLTSVYQKDYNNDYLRARKSYNNLSINSKLSNYIIINDKYNITMHELIEHEDFLNCIHKKEELRIAVCPLLNINVHDIFNITYTEDRKFCIDGMKEKVEKDIILRCTQFIDSLTDNVDFLIFPEMLMTERIINSISAKLSEKDIKFIFYGSVWKHRNNICHVFYEDTEIFEYYKKIPFDLKYTKEEFKKIINDCINTNQKKLLNTFLLAHDFKEKIIFNEQLIRNLDIHIIDINHFGRIFTYICRDIDDDCYMNFTRSLQGDFIILPACSPSSDLASNAVTLSERYHCTTIMCNTCSSLRHLIEPENSLNKKIDNKSRIGFIVTPSKDDTTRSHRKFFYTFNNDCKNCDSGCNGRIFNIGLKELFSENNIVSLNIKEIKRC